MDGKDTREQLIRGIAERATMYGFATQRDAKDAWRLVKEIDGYDPTNKGCGSCIKRCINILRAQVGMQPVQQEIPAKYWKQREAICRGGCPVYVKATDSCGRLVLDAISSRPVTLSDGSVVYPCGCPLITASRWKDKKCPAGFWPEVKE